MAADCARVPAGLPEPGASIALGASVPADGGGPGKPAPHRAFIFSVVGMALLMSALDGTIVATALRAIQHGLHASINWTGWAITAYSAGMVLMLSFAGTLSSRFGRRRFFLVSVTVFAVASLCCGLATNIYMLVALRAVQAAGGAGFVPSATAIIVDTFGSARDKAVGLFGGLFSIGWMIGPIFGALFVTYWTWRGIFFVNVPISAVLVLMGLRFVPRDAGRRPSASRPVDFTGMALLGLGVLTFMVGISEFGDSSRRPWSPLFIVPLGVGILALAQFARHIRRAADPFISPHLIAGKGFGAVNVLNVLYGGTISGLVALVPLYAIDRYHVSVLGSGTLLVGEGAAVVVMSTLGAAVLRRTGYRLPLYLGSSVIVLGLAALAARPPGLSAYAWLAVTSCVIGIGTGFADPAGRNAGLQLAPTQSASIAALRSTGRQVGSIMAVSLTTAMLAHSTHPGKVQALVYLGFAALLLVAMPTIARIPEHRGAW